MSAPYYADERVNELTSIAHADTLAAMAADEADRLKGEVERLRGRVELDAAPAVRDFVLAASPPPGAASSSADSNLRPFDVCRCGDYRRDHRPECHCRCHKYRPHLRAVHVLAVS